jgi:hypothetical protein
MQEIPVISTRAELPILAPEHAQKLSPSINVQLVGAGEVFGRYADGRAS